MIEQIITALYNFPNETIYLFLFVIALIEYILPPIPGDTIIVFGAYLVGVGRLDLFTVYILITLGSMSGFLVSFFVGKHYGRWFFLKKNYRFFSREMILKTEKWFQRYGVGLIAANRFLSGARSAISLIAGISNMKVFATILAALFSSMIWNAILISGGYYLGKNWHAVITIIKRYNQFVIIVIILSLLFYLWKIKKNRNSA
jgi:membrane protein DedA with SNARE-associated domain